MTLSRSHLDYLLERELAELHLYLSRLDELANALLTDKQAIRLYQIMTMANNTLYCKCRKAGMPLHRRDDPPYPTPNQR